MNPRKLLLVVPALASALATARADEMYKCVDDKGNVTFANTGNTRGCSRINVDPVVIPKFVAPGKPAGASNAQPGFPKVDPATQRARDSDRRRILEDELRDKQARLADLKKEYNGGEPERQGNERNYQKYLDRVELLKSDIARTESDIASIRSEIDKIQ